MTQAKRAAGVEEPGHDDAAKSDKQNVKATEETNADVSTDDNHGIVVGRAHDVTYNTQNHWHTAPEPPVVDRLLADATWHHATNHFEPGTGFVEARHTLSREHLVFLRFEGTGREFSGIRMLIDLGVKRISHLNDRRAFDSLRMSDLEPAQGYLWSGLDPQWQKRITSRAAHRLAHFAKEAGAYVVVAIDDHMPLPSGLERFEETLGTPDALTVAIETLRAQHGFPRDEAEIILDEDFREHLPTGTPPNRAEDVAIRAREVYRKERDREDALAYLSRDLQNAVFEWFHHPDRSSIEYAMLVAIAVFEHHDYNQVVESGKELERMIVEIDSEGQKRLRRRQIFEFSKEALLNHLQADVAWRRHSDDLNFHMETVHFVRSAWAREAFRRLWDQYDLIRLVIVKWMTKHATGSSQWYCAKALHDVTVHVATSDPMEHIHELAGSRSHAGNHLAVELLSRFAEDDRTKSVVEPTLQAWCNLKQEYHRKWTAVQVYATDYGKRDATTALSQLEQIARDDDRLLDEVKAAVLSLLDRPENRTLVLGKLQFWTNPFRLGAEDEQQRLNLRAVGLDCAQAALGLLPDTRYLRSLPPKTAGEPSGDPDTSLVAALFRRVFLDKRTASNALRTLLDFGDYCATRPDGDAAKGLVQLLDTVAPRLHDRADHLLFHTWSEDFPERSHRIHRLFGIVQRLQYQHS